MLDRKTVRRTQAVLLAAVWWAALGASAYAVVEIHPMGSSSASGGSMTGQVFTVGSNGSVFEYGGLVIPAQPIADPAAQERFRSTIQLAVQTASDGRDGFVRFTVTNQSATEVQTTRIVIYVDVDIDRLGKPANDEFVLVSGMPEQGSAFEAADLENSNLFARLHTGSLSGTVSPASGSSGDPVMAFSFDDTVPAHQSRGYSLMLSDKGNKLSTTGLALEQRDAVLSTRVTVSAARFTPAVSGRVGRFLTPDRSARSRATLR